MTPDETDLTAAELALGVLEGDEYRAASQRLLADPAFARDVARWRRHLAGFYLEVEPATPSRELERKILAVGDNDNRPAGPWRAIAGVAGIAAAVLLTVVITRPDTPPPVVSRPSQRAPLLFAVLTPEKAAPITAFFDPNTRTLKLRDAPSVTSGKDAQLWAIGSDGVPHAAGLLSQGRAAPLKISPQVAMAAGTTLAISVEPKGGSPKPTPTGPVIAAGQLTKI
jgi:anti-sigma-K factor RskA